VTSARIRPGHYPTVNWFTLTHTLLPVQPVAEVIATPIFCRTNCATDHLDHTV